MNPVLHAMARLLDGVPGMPGDLSTAELADTLSEEPRLRMATRLALVRLAARCEQHEIEDPAEARPCTFCAPLIARRLERLAEADDQAALAGLVELAPELRELHEALAREHSPLGVLPRALLELLGARLH